MFLVIILLMTVAAIGFVAWPLIRKTAANEEHSLENHQTVNLEATRQQIRDIKKDYEDDLIAQDQLNPIRNEAENTLLMEMQARQRPEHAAKSSRFHRITALVLSLMIPVSALLIYLSVGTPAALMQTAEDTAQPSMEQLIARLEQRLAENPGDEEGWLVLAQTNMMMRRFDQAVVAMERLYELDGDSPDVLARYADSLVMANNGIFTPKAGELIEQALRLDPSHLHGLWLAGVQAFEAQDFDLAVGFFQKARVHITDPENLVQIDELIRTAEQSMSADAGIRENIPPQDAAMVEVSVSLSPGLQEKAEAGQTLFVIASAADGPPMPLAVSRHTVAELPLQVSLDDSMAMMQNLKLSGFEQVVIRARISGSGQPLAQPGDLQGESGIINPNTLPQVSITIDQVLD